MRSSLRTASSLRLRSPDLRGRKPSKAKRSVGSPDATKAERSADGPGIGETLAPARRQARTRKNASSETPGVPASQIKAKLLAPQDALDEFVRTAFLVVVVVGARLRADAVRGKKPRGVPRVLAGGSRRRS